MINNTIMQNKLDFKFSLKIYDIMNIGDYIMNKKKNNLISAILMLIGAICFGIMTYAHFYRGNNILGCLCLIATICDIISGVLNYIHYKK